MSVRQVEESLHKDVKENASAIDWHTHWTGDKDATFIALGFDESGGLRVMQIRWLIAPTQIAGLEIFDLCGDMKPAPFVVHAVKPAPTR